MLDVVFGALAPEAIIIPLLAGDGATSTSLVAGAYEALSAQLDAAAANTDGSMLQMGGGVWGGLSADQAQVAFRNHSNWLREQALVAKQTARVADAVVAIYNQARSEMAGVAAWCAEVRARETGLLLSTALGAPTGLGLIETEAELLAVRGAALGVMAGYAAELLPTLATLPPPIEAPPIVTGGGDSGVGSNYSPFDTASNGTTDNTGTGHTQTTSTTNNTGSDSGGDSTSKGGGDNGSTDPAKPTDPTQPTDPTNSTPADPQQLAPEVDPSSLSGDSGAQGASDQQWLYGASQNSTTLAGLNGGVGSLVAINMMRGGLGSMPGASTGFRMPASWLRAPGASFGPTSNPVSTGPASRGGPPRRVVSADARRRRRRRDEERKPGKVFVPGEQFEVPVLEKPPVIGVIEYTDRPEESVADQEILVGVIGRVDDDADSNAPVLPR
ncbi:PPE domain-containing protein [Nocardia sp. NPDC052112]|uniref:PPE domain-containing protein n=1 Tax=Nocardia sp. NPDC052112 TaxID=3155646 RepID=UPI003420AAE6